MTRLRLDHQFVLHNPEDVTYRSVTKLGRGAAVSVEVPRACRVPLTTFELAKSNGAYVAGDVTFQLPSRPLEADSVTPKPGDRITACGSETWTVLSVIDGRFANFWELTARNLTLAYALTEKVTIRRPVNALTNTGERYAGGWRYLGVDVTARVQPEASGLADGLGGRAVERLYTVFLEDGLEDDIAGHEQVVWAGKVLEVTGYEEPERIDELFRLKCRLSLG